MTTSTPPHIEIGGVLYDLRLNHRAAYSFEAIASVKAFYFATLVIGWFEKKGEREKEKGSVAGAAKLDPEPWDYGQGIKFIFSCLKHHEKFGKMPLTGFLTEIDEGSDLKFFAISELVHAICLHAFPDDDPDAEKKKT